MYERPLWSVESGWQACCCPSALKSLRPSPGHLVHWTFKAELLELERERVRAGLR